LDCKKQLNGHINWEKGGKSGRGHAWIMDKVSKVIMFEKTLEFKTTFLLCYGKQKN